MNILHRIYTEDIAAVRHYVQGHFESCTIISATGVWKGKAEHSIIIEVLSQDNFTYEDTERIIAACKVIKTLGKQEAVLWTRGAVASGLV